MSVNKTRREQECLVQLQYKTLGLDDILAFLKEEKLIDDVQIKTIRSSAEYPKEIQKVLWNLKQSEKIQLLEYFWQVLPVEQIKILIITNRAQKEFTYDE